MIQHLTSFLPSFLLGVDISFSAVTIKISVISCILITAHGFPHNLPEPKLRTIVRKFHGGIYENNYSHRSDFPNQINNVLAFPVIFRGALDCGARDINYDMKVAAAQAIAELVTPDKLSAEYIIPGALEEGVAEHVAKRVAEAAVKSGAIRK